MLFLQIFDFFLFGNILKGVLFFVWGMTPKGEILIKNHHLIKGILGFSLFFLIFGFSSPFTFAEGIGLQDIIGEISYRANFLYILLWPFVFLAGLFLDNSLVYGETFGFDGLLWNLRNIVKNISNFGLGVLLLWNIGKTIRNGDAQSTFSVNTLKGPLIAGILIQMSWFLMATLIDISTIATYGIWGLPLSLEKTEVQGDDAKKQRYTYGFHMDMNLNSDEESYTLYRTTKNHYIAPCFVIDTVKLSGDVDLDIDLVWVNDWENTKEKFNLGEIPWITWSYLTLFYGAKEPKSDSPANGKTLTWYCHIGNRVYSYKNPNNRSDENIKNVKHEFTAQHDKHILPAEELNKWLQSWVAIQEMSILPYNCEQTKFDNFSCYSPESFNTELSTKGEDGLYTLKDLYAKYQTSLGAFSSFFGSIISVLDFQNIGNGSTSDFERFFTLSYNTLFIVLLAIPLATIGIIMAYRVFVLWTYIILLPFIILTNAFQINSWTTDDFSLWGESKWIFSISEILKTIFAPVIINFALSIAVLFTSTMYEVFTTGNYYIDFNNSFMNIDDWISFGKAWGENIWKLVIAISGLVLTWILMFTAIKAGKLWWAIGKAIDDTATKFIKTVPIIPTSKWRLNLDSLSTTKLEDLWRRKLDNTYGDYNRYVLNSITSPLTGDKVDFSLHWKNINDAEKRAIEHKILFTDDFTKKYKETQNLSLNELYNHNFKLSDNISEFQIKDLIDSPTKEIKELQKLSDLLTMSDKEKDEIPQAIADAIKDNNTLKGFLQTKKHTIKIKAKDGKEYTFARNDSNGKFEEKTNP